MYYIGVDFGGMSIKGGLVDEKGNFVYKTVIETHPDAPSDEIAADVARLIEEVADKSGIGLANVLSVGIGVPGACDSKRGYIYNTTNVNFTDYYLAAEVQKRLSVKLPVYLDNDANCAALGEVLFGGRKITDALMVTLGTGVGTGIIVDGKIFGGYRNMGGEGGHTCLKMGGEKCGCGAHGCFEAYASATGLIRQTKDAIAKNPDSMLARIAEKNSISGKTAFEAARLNDKAAKAVVRRYIKYVGAGIVSILNLLGSEYVIVGGGISREGDFFIKPLSRYINRNKFGSGFYPKTKVVAATLLNDAGIVGAAALGFNR